MQETKTTVRASTLSNGRSLAAYHEDFDRKWASAWGRTLTYAQMHANRVVQSARIVLSHPDIWGKVASGFVNAARGAQAFAAFARDRRHLSLQCPLRAVLVQT